MTLDQEHTIPIESVIVDLMNLRAQIAFGSTTINDKKELRGADRALTMAIEDFNALLQTREQLTGGRP